MYNKISFVEGVGGITMRARIVKLAPSFNDVTRSLLCRFIAPPRGRLQTVPCLRPPNVPREAKTMYPIVITARNHNAEVWLRQVLRRKLIKFS